MNENEIRNMEAGREMDALIAERVMELDEVRRQVFGPNIIWTADDRVYEVPHYSTDIAAAWQVVEKLDRGPIDIWVTAGPEIKVQLMGYGSMAVAPTAPLAICRAALLARRQGE